MKSIKIIRYIIIIVTLSIFSFSCKAQIAPLYFADPDLPEGTYYKDLDNDLNKFEGIWRWENNSNSLEIIMEKKEQVQVYNNTKLEDMIVGEYEYVENNVEIINSLPRFNDSSIVGFKHYISGSRLMSKFSPPLKCDDCTIDERRIQLFFHDPGTPHIPMQIILRHVVDNGVEKLQAMIVGGGSYVDSTTYPNTPRVPFGVYFTLVKQD